MIVRHLHFQILAAVAEILGSEHGALLADEQSGGIRVASDVVRADTQVGDLEILSAPYVETRIQYSMLGRLVAFFWRHRARTERMPSGFDMTLDPFLNVLQVTLGVLKVIARADCVGVEEVRLRRFR